MRKGFLRACSRAGAMLAISALITASGGAGLFVPRLAQADGAVVTGQVTISGTTTGVSGVTMELHTPDGNTSFRTTTDTNGNYTFTDSLVSGTNYVAEYQAPTGYNRVEPHSQNFTYTAGDAVRTYNFQLVAASKTISGHISDTNGVAITDADIGLTPYNNTNAASVTARTDASGNYTAAVIGGTWFVQPSVNLSEYTQRWIAENPPVRVDFTNDSTSETSTQNFTVTPATGKVSVILLNSDGSKLTTSNFVADIDFRRADGAGTKRKVQQADSSVSVYLTPGIYTISAFHSDLAGKSFDPAKTTFVMTEGATVDLGTVRAQTNTAHLKGKVTGGDGKALSNVNLMAIRDGGSERPTINSRPDGTFDLVVGAGTWTIGLNSTDLTHSQQTPVTATVKNGETVSGLNITLKTIDRTISGSVLNSSGSKVTDYIGTAYVRTSDKKIKISAPVISGAFTIKYASSDLSDKSVVIGVEAADNSTYAGGTESKLTLSGSTGTKNITVKSFNSTMSGTLKLANGTAVTSPGSEIDIEAVDELGNFVSVAAAADGTYSLPLAAGTWQYDYNIIDPDATDGLLNKPAAESSVTIAANQTLTGKHITVAQGKNTISGKVTDASGAAVKSASVHIDNRATLENSASTTDGQLMSVTAETDASGKYSAEVPDGTYLVTVGDMPKLTASQLEPNGKSVTIKGGKSATANLKFITSDATITGTVKLDGKTEGGGTVTAYDDNGGTASARVGTNGVYTLKVTSGETWHVDVTDVSGKKLVANETADIAVKKGANTANISLSNTGLTVDGPKTASCSSDAFCTVSLPGGASASIPPFGIDITGTVSLTITPVIAKQGTTLDTPASLSYEVKALDSDGNEVKSLNKPAEIVVPIDQSAAESTGVVTSRLAPSYFNPQTQTWESSGTSGIVNAKTNTATIETTHLSKFSVTGTKKKAPKLSNVVVQSVDKKNVVLRVTGSGFSGTVTGLLGSVKTTAGVVKDGGNTVILTFPAAKLKSTSYKLVVTNGNGRTVTRNTLAIVKGNKKTSVNNIPERVHLILSRP